MAKRLGRQCHCFCLPQSMLGIWLRGRRFRIRSRVLYVLSFSLQYKGHRSIFLSGCGGAEDLPANLNIAPDTDCNSVCTGDPTEFCGNGNRLQMYTWQGNLNVFHQPSNTGRYEFFGKDPAFRFKDYLTRWGFYSAWVTVYYSLSSARF
jgi:hypothetical protein